MLIVLTNHEQMERLEYKMRVPEKEKFFAAALCGKSGSSRDLIIRNEKIEKKIFFFLLRHSPPLRLILEVRDG